MRAVVPALLFLILVFQPALASSQGPVGSEFQVNSTVAYDQDSSAVVSTGSNTFVVVWRSTVEYPPGAGMILGQRFGNGGTPIGFEFPVTDPAPDTYVRYHPSVAADSGGEFVVVWGEDSDEGIVGSSAQRFDAEAQRLGTEFYVNSGVNPDVARLPSGSFVVVGKTSDTIFCRRFGDSGTQIGDEMVVWTAEPFWILEDPAVDLHSTGTFVVVWGVHEEGSPEGIIYGRKYYGDGVPAGDEFEITSLGLFHDPDVATLSSGHFIVTWHGRIDSTDCILGRIYSDTGPLGDAFQLSSDAQYFLGPPISPPTVAANKNDRFVVSWLRSEEGIRARYFAENGTPINDEFKVSSYPQSSQSNPAIAALTNDAFVTTWESSQAGDLDCYGSCLPFPRFVYFNEDDELPFEPYYPFDIDEFPAIEWALTTDFDSDGEEELIIEDPTRPAGQVLAAHADTPLDDVDVLFVGTLGEGRIFGFVDVIVDETSETELVVESPTLASGTYVKIDVDNDLDFDVLFIGTQGGGTVALTTDYDGDGEAELVVDDPTRPAGNVYRVNVNPIDGDSDVLYVGTLGGGHVLELVDLEIDSSNEPELIVEAATLAAGVVQPVDIDSDNDEDVIFVGTKDGGAAVLTPDLDGDHERELVVESPTMGIGAVSAVNLSATDNDFDVLFVSTVGGGAATSSSDFDSDGEDELIVESPVLAELTVIPFNADSGFDDDADVLFISTTGGGQVYGLVDLTIDDTSELELIVEAATRPAGEATAIDIDSPQDGDADVVFVGTLGGGKAVATTDLDGDGEVELIVEATTLSAGEVTAVDVDSAPDDLDVLFVSTQNGGTAVGAADIDGDIEAEVIVADVNSPAGTISGVDVDPYDSDVDVLFLGTAGGGRVAGGFDLDGDCEVEVVVEDPGSPADTVSVHDVVSPTSDGDCDVLFVGTQNGGAVAGSLDIDGDGEQELIINNAEAPAGSVVTHDVNCPISDGDCDLLWVGAQNGDTAIGAIDIDGDSEKELVVENSGALPGSVLTSDVDTPIHDTDWDVLFVGTQNGGIVSGASDLDHDGEVELIVEDRGSSAGVLPVNVDNTTGDSDHDVLFVGTQSGGRVVGTTDVEEDGLDELIVEDAESAPGTTTSVNLSVPAGTDIDMLFVGTRSGGSVRGVSNIVEPGLRELIVEDVESNPGTVTSLDVDSPLNGDTDVIFVTRPYPSITVSAPTEGVKWYIGASEEIQWTSSYITGYLEIAVSRDGGPFDPIDSFANNDGTEPWQVEGPGADEAVIRITSLNDPTVYGDSGTFSIPQITFTEPVVWPIGTNQEICWEVHGLQGDTLDVRLSRDAGASYEVLFSVPATSGCEGWPVVGPATDQAQLQIVSQQHPVAVATSGLFSISGAFVVNSAADTADSDLADGLCDDGTGSCTLRAAIQQANSNLYQQQIVFDLPTQPWLVPTISPTSSLPDVTDAIIIDGTTQSAGKVEIEGSSAGYTAGLRILGGDSTVRGLVINRFQCNGLVLLNNGNNLVEGNLIGTDPTGTVDLGNAWHGLLIKSSSNNTIGGDTTGAGNVFSGNAYSGVRLGVSSSFNHILGNLIGTDASGAAALGNSQHGISLLVSGSYNTIEDNLIAFNNGDGVSVLSGTLNGIVSNTIFANGGLAIDLGNDGPTANDAGDADGGPNNLQNFPVITSLSGGSGSYTCSGTLSTNPPPVSGAPSYLIELFGCLGKTCSGGGDEGQVLLGTTEISVDSLGFGTFQISLTSLQGASLVAATATSIPTGLPSADLYGDTSELSDDFTP